MNIGSLINQKKSILHSFPAQAINIFHPLLCKRTSTVAGIPYHFSHVTNHISQQKESIEFLNLTFFFTYFHEFVQRLYQAKAHFFGRFSNKWGMITLLDKDSLFKMFNPVADDIYPDLLKANV